MDHLIDPNIDLSIETLSRICKGNVKALPSFMVHSDPVWPNHRRVALDNQNRIHMRRSTFLRAVAATLPVRAGIWHRVDVQEFFLDLQPHHLQGSSDMDKPAGYAHSRAIIRADAVGRTSEDPDYNDPAIERKSDKRPALSRSEILAATGGKIRGVRSAWLADRGD